MDTCICTAESLHCLPETITTLLIGYTPVQNKNFKKKKEKESVKEHLLSGRYVPGTILSVEVHACSVIQLCLILCDLTDSK